MQPPAAMQPSEHLHASSSLDGKRRNDTSLQPPTPDRPNPLQTTLALARASRHVSDSHTCELPAMRPPPHSHTATGMHASARPAWGELGEPSHPSPAAVWDVCTDGKRDTSGRVAYRQTAQGWSEAAWEPAAHHPPRLPHSPPRPLEGRCQLARMPSIGAPTSDVWRQAKRPCLAHPAPGSFAGRYLPPDLTSSRTPAANARGPLSFLPRATNSTAQAGADMRPQAVWPSFAHEAPGNCSLAEMVARWTAAASARASAAGLDPPHGMISSRPPTRDAGIQAAWPSLGHQAPGHGLLADTVGYKAATVGAQASFEGMYPPPHMISGRAPTRDSGPEASFWHQAPGYGLLADVAGLEAATADTRASFAGVYPKPDMISNKAPTAGAGSQVMCPSFGHRAPGHGLPAHLAVHGAAPSSRIRRRPVSQT